MWYALLSTGSLGAIGCLILLIQRNQARTELVELTQTLINRTAELQRSQNIIQSLHGDIDRLTQERNELAKNNPAAAGDILSGVLTSSS